MPDGFYRISATRAALSGLDRWTVGAIAVAALVLLPIVMVLGFALNPSDNLWPHLIATTLPRYLANTGVLMAGVGALTVLIGTATAWLVVMYRFPGRGWLQWALLTPLAIPAYVGAYALVDFLEYAGPVQTALRDAFGWQTARDYWFPEIRTRWAAILVMGLALYPYVYILARAAFREQSGAGYEVARALGAGPWARFLRVGLPLARPAIAAGVAVVLMETVNDFGTVDFFSVQTLTTGIFSVWRQGGNLAGAAQIACVVLAVIVLLVTLEKLSRRRSRHAAGARNQRPVTPEVIGGARALLATLVCMLPVLLGFVLPLGVILSHAFDARQWAAPGLIEALLRTMIVCGLAAVLTVLGGVLMVYGVRLSGRRGPLTLMPVTGLGYAIPGAVLALGILAPVVWLDNRLADAILWLTGTDPGLLMTGSAGVLVLAYVIRFFAIAQGAADAALGRVPASLPMAARSLGRSAGQTLRAVHVPLMRASVGSALLLVFVDGVKELPATLMLFHHDTLATRVHAKASLEDLAEAAPAALVISLVGLAAVALLARTNR